MDKLKKDLHLLLNIDSINFHSGSFPDKIHPGQILEQYIVMGVRSKAYHLFTTLLNDCLTLYGIENLLLISRFTDFSNFYEELKDTYPEAIILKEFKSIVELIQIQLQDQVLHTQNEINSFSKNVTERVIDSDETLTLFIDKEKAYIIVKDELTNEYTPRFKTARELTQIDLFAKTQNEWSSQIADLLIKNISSITKQNQ